jgi:hypothetical protein
MRLRILRIYILYRIVDLSQIHFNKYTAMDHYLTKSYQNQIS